MQLSEFKTYVKYDFKRNDKDTELVQFYNDMVMWVAMQMPHAGYKFQSYITTSVDIEDYEIPSNAIHLMHPVKLIIGTGDSDTGYPLSFLTKSQYDLIEPNPNRSNPYTGRPTKYCVYGRKILVTPVPDLATYILEINWSKRPTALSGDSEVTSLGSEWDEVLKQGTLERLYDSLEMYEEARYWGSKYHQLNSRGDDVPVGLCRRLFDIEFERESSRIGTVCNNEL